MNLKLDLNMESIKALLPKLLKAQPYVFGFALIGVFGYTAYFVNASLNVTEATTQTEIKALPPISFDKATISSLKTSYAVNGDVPISGLGTSNPFK